MKQSLHQSNGISRHLLWLVIALLLAAFALADGPVVAWYAHTVTGAEILAGAITFALISLGAITTIWHFDR
jgi:hypothetical protein